MKSRLDEGGKKGRGERSSIKSLMRLISFVKPHCFHFIAALLALCAGSGINLLFPEVARRALEPQAFAWVVEHLGTMTVILLALFIVQGAAFYLRSYLFGLIGQRVFSELRAHLFRAISYKNIPFFDGNRSGDLTTRLTSDAALVQDAVSIKFSIIVRYGVQVLFGVVLMAWMSWRLTVALVGSVLLMVATSALFIRSLKAASRKYQSALAALTAFAAECFSGAKIVRSLAAQGDAVNKFNVLNTEARVAAEKRTFISASFSSGASLLLNLLLVLVQWYGISLVVSERLPLNDLAAFVLYGAIVAVSFAFLISSYTELMQSVGGLERVFELLDGDSARGECREVRSSTSVLTQQVEGPTICFSDVSFAYPSRPNSGVLNGVTLTLDGGKTTALVGPSGAGKSSIVQLLLRFYPRVSGTITISERALEDFSEEEVRALIAWVPQEPHLFGFTIYENLVFGNNTLSREDISEHLAGWRFMDFIKDLPEGLDTLLGEQGAQLSGGQRQRVAIARALLRRPPVLILDEGTSGLDSEVEETVLQTIKEHLPRSTVLLISHRLATVHRAEQIVVIEDGKVIEEGSHAQLSAGTGLYSQYARRQALA
jgi:ABC-type multidrug transport system fused ATPase/permease subunit